MLLDWGGGGVKPLHKQLVLVG